ncbi:flagellar motor switch protein FliM [Sedimentibacter sp. zth1]|uniref:flagellar motor switch protein FliM n=1 Tax=Sedimentibacter sp. zth1 TaxID=2816908 RepID=UPI001A92BDD5|nr:flagellar motor switch protein FliM [Sedimentibacter sp. zth1]QSX07191.1 flagellar motor switch protein FliM [Sedimentibacter sp. zth1]
MADILSQNQIDALLNNLTSGEVDIEQINTENEDGKIKVYDFSSPKKVTRENIKLLNGVYESYGRILSSYLSAVLRLFCEIEVEQIEESIFYEYNNALSDSVLLCVVDFLLPDSKNSCGQVLMNFSKPLAFSIIDKLMGGNGDDYNYDRDFTDIELSILDNLMRQIIAKMQDAWQGTVPIIVEFNKIETNARFIQSIGYNDTVLLIVMNTVVKQLNGSITVCIPTLTLDEIFKKSEHLLRLGRKKSDLQQAEMDKEAILGYVKASNLNISGVLGKADLSLNDVLNIQLGDVIVLDKGVNEDITMNVEDQLWFKGKWGVKRKRNAIKIKEILY